MGYNVIEAVVRAELGPSDKEKVFKRGFPTLNNDKIHALVNFLQAEDAKSFVRVTTYKQGALIRAHSSISIPCRIEDCHVDRRTPVIFEFVNGFVIR